MQLRTHTTNKGLSQSGEYIVILLQNYPRRSIPGDAALLRTTLYMSHPIHIVLLNSLICLKLCPLFLQLVCNLYHLLIFPAAGILKTTGPHPSIIATHPPPATFVIISTLILSHHGFNIQHVEAYIEEHNYNK